MNPAMMQQMHSMPPRRRAFFAALWPPALILSAYALLFLGVIGRSVYLFFITALTFYLLGRASVVLADNAATRRGVIAHLEDFIGHMHSVLDSDELSDSGRHDAEAALTMAMQSLNVVERAAPPLTRWRERRAREKASR